MIKRYKTNHREFDPITKPSIAYLLGIIATDGCVHRNCLSFGFGIKDLEWLKLIKNILKVTNKIAIRTVKDRKYCYLSECSTNLINNLAYYNITPKKSLTLKFPHKLNKNLIRHFIRGVVDGDGSVVFHYNKNSKCYKQDVKICGASRPFLNSIKIILKTNKIKCTPIECQPRIHLNKHDLYVLHITKDSLNDFYNYLYKGTTFYLPRKKTKYTDLLKHRRYQNKYGGNGQERNIKLRKLLTKTYLKKQLKTKTLAALADELKIWRTTLYKHLERHGKDWVKKYGSQHTKKILASRNS